MYRLKPQRTPLLSFGDAFDPRRYRRSEISDFLSHQTKQLGSSRCLVKNLKLHVISKAPPLCHLQSEYSRLGGESCDDTNIHFVHPIHVSSIVFYTPMSIGYSSTSSVNRPLISLPETFKVKTKWERLLWWFLENDGSYSNDKKLQKKKQVTKGWRNV